MNTQIIICWLLFFLLVPAALSAQIIQGQQNLLIPPDAGDGSTSGITISEATVTGVGVLNDCKRLERVLLNINHTWVGDVAIFLISPAGTVLELTSRNGGASDNWTNTEFRDDAPGNIVDGAAPYTGAFRPEGRQQSLTAPFSNAAPLETFTLANTFAGENADGTWQLYVNDFVFGDIGEILNWELEFSTNGSVLTVDLGDDLEICFGESVLLTGSGDGPFTWGTGETGNAITVAPTVTTTYIATAGSGTCAGTDEITVTVTPPPSIAVIADVDNICAGDPAVLTAVGDGPFTWSDGQTGPSITVSPTSTTTYTATAGASTCQATGDITITVNIPPSLSLGEDATICEGEATSLTAFGTFTSIVWNDGSTDATIALHPLGTQTYTATASNGSCTTSATVAITINPAPTVTAGPDQEICAGDPAVLTAVGDGPFTWSDGQTGPSIEVFPAVTTTYFVDVGTGACTGFDQVVVTVSDPPTLDLGGDQTFCEGEMTSLTASGTFSAIVWGGGETNPTIPLHTTGTQTYTATASNGSCTTSESVAITINPAPTVTAGPDQEICAGDPAVLTAVGDGPFTWSDGQTGPSIEVFPAVTTTYFVDVGTGACTGFDQVVVTVSDPPTLDLGGDLTLCQGEATSLTASGNFTDITWADGQTSPAVALHGIGTQNYTATASNGSCAVTESIDVTIIAAPVVTAGPDTSLCSGDSLVIRATGTGPFTWSTGEAGPSIRVSPIANAVYSVSVGGGNCGATDEVLVTVRPIPSVDLGPNLTVCAGEDLTLASQFAASAYAWSDGSSGDSLRIQPAANGAYALTVTTNGCTAADTLNVLVAEPAFDLGDDQIICPGDSLTLTGPAAEVFAWSTGATERILRLAPTTDQEIVLVATIDGCQASDTLGVRVSNDLSLSFGTDPVICPGDSVTLRPVGTGPFRWSTGEVATEITLRPAASTFVSATVGAGNCAVSDSVFLTVLPAATVNLGDDLSLCPGDVTELIPEGDGVAFVWSTGADSSVLPVQPDTSVNIGVTASNAAGCTATDTVRLRVVVPRLSLEDVPEVCPGDTLTLRASQADVYAWETGENTAEIVISPVVSTVYRVTGFTEGCSLTDSLSVTVLPRATVAAGENQTVCPGTTVVLTASGDGPFRWSDGSVGPELEVSPAAAETLFAVAGEGNCRDTAFVRVDLFPEVTAQLGVNQEICRGDSVALLAETGTVAFSWSDGDFGVERLVSPDQTTTYRIVASGNGCSAADSVTVTVNALPVPELLATDCAPDNLSYSVTLAIVGGRAPFRVNDVMVTDSIVLAGIPSGTSFTALITDANGCETTLTDEVDCGCTEIVLGAAARGCNGSSESRELNALLPSGAPAGTWSVLNPDPNGRPVVSGTGLSLLGCAAGRYVLQFTPAGAALDCLPGYQTIIEVEDPPSAGVQALIEERCAESTGELDLFSELSGAVAGGSWEAASDNTTTNPAADLANGRFLATGQPPGDYRFRYRAPEGAGCEGGVAEVTVRLVRIEVRGTALPPGCEDACGGSILVIGANPTWLYVLDDGVPFAGNRFGSLCAGTYELRAEDERGCTATEELTIPEVVIPEIEVQGNTNLMLGDSSILRLLTNTPPDSVVWSDDVNCLDPSCLTVSVRPEKTSAYTVFFTSRFGCRAVTTVRVRVDERVGVYVPTAFSPNGDGVNDLLTVYAGEAILSVENFRLFDRWGGQLVDFERVPLGDTSFGWDGRTADGRALPPAVYVYQLTVTRLNGTTELVTGEVTLMR